MKNVVAFLVTITAVGSAFAQPGAVIDQYETTLDSEVILSGITLVDGFDVEHRMIALQGDGGDDPRNRYFATYITGNGSEQTMERDYWKDSTFLDMIIWNNECYVLAYQALGGDTMLRIDRFAYDAQLGSMDVQNEEALILDQDHSEPGRHYYDWRRPNGEFDIVDGKLVVRTVVYSKIDNDLRLVESERNEQTESWVAEDSDWVQAWQARGRVSWADSGDFYSFLDFAGTGTFVADKETGLAEELNTHFDFISYVTRPVILEAGDGTGDHFIVRLESYDPRENINDPEVFTGDARTAFVVTRVTEDGEQRETVGYPLTTKGKVEGEQFEVSSTGLVTALLDMPYVNHKQGSKWHGQVVVAGIHPATGTVVEAVFNSTKSIQIHPKGGFSGEMSRVIGNLTYDTSVDATYQLLSFDMDNADTIHGDFKRLQEELNVVEVDADLDVGSNGAGESGSSGGSLTWIAVALAGLLTLTRRRA